MNTRKLLSLIERVEVWLLQNSQDKGYQEWCRRLQAARRDLEQKPTVPIALVGSTGAGKSTLLNALLGQSLLAVSDMKPCTAAVTRVRYAETDDYHAEITYLTRKEWDEELRVLLQQISTERDSSEQDNTIEWEELGRSVRDKFRAVYGLLELPPNLANLQLPPEIEPLLDSLDPKQIIQESDPKLFKKRLKSFLSSDGNLWPLVKTVTISGPFVSLRSGAMLIDLPGMNDPNEAREMVTRKWLTEAPFIWIVFNMKRSITKDIRTLLVDQKLLRKLLLDGKTDALTLVGTHSDEYSEDSIDELGLGEDACPSDIIRARARRVESDVRDSLEDMATELAGQAIENVDALRQLKSKLRKTCIFAVSSPAYMKLQRVGIHRKDYGLDSPDETGVPAVVQHLGELCRKYGTEAHAYIVGQKVQMLLDEILQSVNRKKVLNSIRHGELQNEYDNLRRLLQQPKVELLDRLEKEETIQIASFSDHKSQFEGKLDEAINRSRNELTDRIQRWQNIHWATLRATVVRKGAFTSPSTGIRYDLNADIADALLSAIPLVWDEFFGIYLEMRVIEIREKLKSGVELFLEKEKGVAKATVLFTEAHLEVLTDEFEVARRSIDSTADEVLTNFQKTIRRVRSDLASAINETIKSMMLPSFEKAAHEYGSGMKKRMLTILTEHSHTIKDQLFTTIQHELKDGIQELGIQFGFQLQTLRRMIGEHADRAIHNLGLGNLSEASKMTESEYRKIEREAGEIDDFRSELVRLEELTD